MQRQSEQRRAKQHLLNHCRSNRDTYCHLVRKRHAVRMDDTVVGVEPSGRWKADPVAIAAAAESR